MQYDKFVDSMWFGDTTVAYCAIGLGGEAGEVLNEIKKEMRDLRDSREVAIAHELGDTLYYLTRLAHLYGYQLDDIMALNISKLEKRQKESGLPTKYVATEK